MAKWDSITQNTARGADLLAYQVSSKAVHLVPDNMPFIKALVGGIAEVQGSPFTSNIQTSKVIQGGKGRIRWWGDLPSFTAVTSETASSTIAIDADRKGAAEFALTHYNLMHTFSVEEMVYSKGDAQWVDNFMQEEADAVIRGLWHKLATDVHGTADQGTSSIGSLARAIDSNDDIGTYLGIARADSNNADLRGITASGSGVSAASLLDIVNDIMKEGGKPDMIVMSKANYKSVRAAVDSAASYNHGGPDSKGFYGSKDLFLGGIPVLLDGYCSDTYVYVLDTSTWQFQWSDAGFKATQPTRAETVRSAMVQHFDFYCGLACRQPRFNGRYKNLTA